MNNNGYNDDKNKTITFSLNDTGIGNRQNTSSKPVSRDYSEEELAQILSRRRADSQSNTAPKNTTVQNGNAYYGARNGTSVSADTRYSTQQNANSGTGARQTANVNDGTQVFNRVSSQNTATQNGTRQTPRINPERSVSARLNGQSQSSSIRPVTNSNPVRQSSNSASQRVAQNSAQSRPQYAQNSSAPSGQSRTVQQGQSRTVPTGQNRTVPSAQVRTQQSGTGMQNPRRLTPSTASPSNNRRRTNSSSGRLKRETALGAKRKKRENNDSVGGTLRSVFKAVGYIVGVLVISIFISIFGISVGNDAFAFVKESNEVQVSIGEYTTITELSSALKKAGAIKYPLIFRIYAKLSHMDDSNFVAGDYTIKTSLNYDQLLNTFAESEPVRTQVSVTIPEGYTIDEIVKLFVEDYGIGTYEGFEYALEEYEWDYWFVQELDNATLSSERKYKLEGYLFPDTYYYFSDSNEVTVVYKMLENFNSKFGDSMRERCTALGYTVDEIVTLASMIQMEAKFPSEYTDISSVFHNRLNYPSYETQGRLESDPSIMYIIGHRTNLTQEEKDMDSGYNTYVSKGLPPSAISNPSLYAINCALYPNDTEYFYFYALSSGYHVFAKTYAEHTQNILDANK